MVWHCFAKNKVLVSITIFLADDNGAFRQALRVLLNMEPDFTVIGEAANGRDAVTQILLLCPAIAILDMVMPELDGITAARQIRQKAPAVQVIILTMYWTEPYLQRALQAGAQACLAKESAGTELATAIRTVHAGLPILPATLF